MSLKDDLALAAAEIEDEEEEQKKLVSSTRRVLGKPEPVKKEEKEEDSKEGDAETTKAKRKPTSFTLPDAHIKLLDAIAACDNTSRSEALVKIIELQAKIYDVRNSLEKIAASKSFLNSWKDALFYALDGYLDLDKKISSFDFKLTSVTHTLSTVAEKLLAISALHEHIKKLSSNADNSLKSMKEFTDQFGIQRQLLELKKELERISSSIERLKNLPAATIAAPQLPSQPRALELMKSKKDDDTVPLDDAINSIPASLFKRK